MSELTAQRATRKCAKSEKHTSGMARTDFSVSARDRLEGAIIIDCIALGKLIFHLTF